MMRRVLLLLASVAILVSLVALATSVRAGVPCKRFGYLADGVLVRYDGRAVAPGEVLCDADVVPSDALEKLFDDQDTKRTAEAAVVLEKAERAAERVRLESDLHTQETRYNAIIDSKNQRIAALEDREAPPCTDSGPSWWTVVGVGVVTLAAGVLVGALAL